MENIKIGIAGMGKGAGASFVTLLLAEEMAERNSMLHENSAGHDGEAIEGIVTVAASGDTYFYDSLGFDSRFQKGSFVPFEEFDQQKAQEYRSAGKLPNINEGISWLVSSPKTCYLKISERERSRILSRITGRYILWDMGHRALELDFEEAVKDVDMMIYVIDPIPSKMLPLYDTFAQIRDCSIPVVYVLNRMNSGVDKKDLMSFLKIKKPVILPWTDPALIYRSEYKCEYPYKNGEIRKAAGPSVRKLADIVTDIAKHKLR